MCPRLTETRPWSSFLSIDFGGSFDDRSEWITEDAGVFPVSVVDDPEIAGGWLSRARAHPGSSAQAADGRMYQLHKVRNQS